MKELTSRVGCICLLSSLSFLLLLGGKEQAFGDEVRYMRVTFLSYTKLGTTGQYGDAVYYEFPGEDGILDTIDDKNLLFDGGYTTSTTQAVANFLDEKIGVGGTIYYMVLSSPGADHYYGLHMAVGRYDVLNYYENVRWPEGAKPPYDSFIQDIEAEGCNIYYYDAGHYLSGPDTTLGPSWGAWSGWDPYIEAKVLCANANSPGGDDNPYAGVIQFRCGESVFLQGGDATSSDQEDWILEETAPHSYSGASDELADTDFYKVHHHGSNNSNSSVFMEQMAAQYAVVTVAHSSSNHPDARALDRINDSGAVVYRVDLDHHVTVRCDDQDNYEITRSMVWSEETDTYPDYTYASGDLHFPPPPLVSGLQVIEETEDHIVLSWNACTTPDTTYDVARAAEPNGADGAGRDTNPDVGEATGIYEKLTASPISYTSYTDTGGIGGIDYYYRIASLQENTEGGYSVTYERRWSDEVKAMKLAFTPTPTPYGYKTPTPTPSTTPTPYGYKTPTPTPTPSATMTHSPTSTPTATPPPAGFPFYDGFESGTLSSEWSVFTDAEGRVTVSSSYPYEGTYAVLLDDSVSGSSYSTAALIMRIDLAGETEVDLDFWWREFNDENDPEDGVFISDNYGSSWYQVLSFNNGPQSYTHALIDLDAAAAAFGLTLNDHFRIKFQFYDNYPLTSDGYGIDEVRLSRPITPTPTPEGYHTPSPSPSITPTPTPTSTLTPTPSVTPTPEGYRTPTPTPSPTATPENLFCRLDLAYSTYLGGNYYDYGYGITVDSSECAYTTGYTYSNNFPTRDSYQLGKSGSYDAFVSKFSSSGTALLFSTYLGGSDDDRGFSIAVDPFYCVYLTGDTISYNFPTRNPYQSSHGGGTRDAFVSKFSSSGTALLFSTYLGGNAYDDGCGIVVGSADRAYLGGSTSSFDFPIKNPYQPANAGAVNAFVSKLSSSGSSLIFSSYLGGSTYDYPRGISLDSANCAYLIGDVYSDNFPTLNSYQASRSGANDAFVTKFSSSGSSLCYSTYLGGDSLESGEGIALDSNRCAYVTGETESLDFPTRDAYQVSWGGGDGDAFVSKFSSSGEELLYSTFLGGYSYDSGYDIAVDSVDCAYVVGETESADFPVQRPYQSSKAEGDDAFVSKFSHSGSFLVYSTFLGGDENDSGYGIAVDALQSPYVTGETRSYNFPTQNPYQASKGDTSTSYRDAFVSKLELVYYLTTPTPTPEGYHSPTPTPTIIPTSTPTPEGYKTPTPTPTASPALIPTATPTPTITATPRRPLWIYDYDGDGTSDIAIFRGTSGLWSVRGITRIYFGSATDLPKPGDYDGDGTTDVGIFRGSSGLWAIRGVSRMYFGSDSDLPVPGDYDGDGCCDAGIFRESSGLWAIKGVTRVYFGSSSDTAVPGYFTGGGIKSMGIFRGGSGLWAIRNLTRIYFGSSADTVVPGDYDGDGTWEYGIFRPSSGLWAIRGLTRVYFGGISDRTVPADYDGDATDDIGIFREGSGLWAVRGMTRVYYGTSGDIPVTR